MKHYPHKNILTVVTNYSGNPDSDIKETGVWLEEFAVPYLVFKATGYDVTVASPKGGLAPVDENSMSCSNPEEWDECIKILRDTKKLSDVNYKEFDALFLPGGHGPMFDLANDMELKEIVEYFFRENKYISAICHGIAGLIRAKRDDGESILKGLKVTGLTNREEKIMKYDKSVPFLLQNKLCSLGACFEEGEPWKEHIVTNRNIITGQNPQSSLALAEHVVKKLS